MGTVLQKASMDKLNDTAKAIAKEARDTNTVAARGTMQTIAELMEKQAFADIFIQLDTLFKEDAVKPALDFLAEKVDDGSLHKILLFVRRILGIK
jgi:hypothetical protein